MIKELLMLEVCMFNNTHNLVQKFNSTYLLMKPLQHMIGCNKCLKNKSRHLKMKTWRKLEYSSKDPKTHWCTNGRAYFKSLNTIIWRIFYIHIINYSSATKFKDYAFASNIFMGEFFSLLHKKFLPMETRC